MNSRASTNQNAKSIVSISLASYQVEIIWQVCS